MKKVILGTILLLAMGVSFVSCKGCTDNAKEAGEEVKDAANDAADQLKETAKEVKDVVKD
jgi:hypothetical protein